MMDLKNNKMLYFLIGCISLSMLIIGGTYAYFTASTTDANTVTGDAATVSFGLTVQKITNVDMAYGLIPMKNNMAPYAASHQCRDNFGNAGCQLYKITVSADSDTVMFLDGYIVTNRQEGVETRISEVILSEDGKIFSTKYTREDFDKEDFDETKYIKTGVRGSTEDISLNHTDDYDCLFIENEKIGGEEVGRVREFYMMIWVYDNGQPQNELQGMQLAYTGTVTFQTAEGNEISATFD